KDAYTAIIFDILESSVDYRVMDCIDNNITKGTKNLAETTTEIMKDVYGHNIDWENYDISSMSFEGREKLANGISEAFKTEHSGAAKVSSITTVISKGIEYAKDLESYCKMVESYYNIWCMNDAVETILREMYAKCPSGELALRRALLECISVMEMNED